MNDSQYKYVKDILVDRMSRYRRSSFQLQRLYEIISKGVEEDGYFTFPYEDFYNMFTKECINGNIPNRKFSISEEGFLDKKKRYPYANIHVEVLPKNRKIKA